MGIGSKLALVAAIGLWTSSVQAGAIIVSGDMTPTFHLTNTPPDFATPGNRRFFENVLGDGDQVLVRQTTNNSFTAGEINEFYNGLAGVTGAIHTGTLTAANLTGVDLFIAPWPSTAFTVSEVAVLDAYLDAGGSLFVLGEGEMFNEGGNTIINSLLSALGSSLSITTGALNIGPQTATGSEIAPHALTSGVTSFSWGSASMVSGGTTLFYTHGNVPFVQVELIDSPISIPEPATMALVAGGLVGFALRRRRKTA